MTNREMMEIAMRQSAEDMGCRVEDLKADKNVVVPINLGKKARKYLKEPITCNLVSYGNNIIAPFRSIQIRKIFLCQYSCHIGAGKSRYPADVRQIVFCHETYFVPFFN